MVKHTLTIVGVLCLVAVLGCDSKDSPTTTPTPAPTPAPAPAPAPAPTPAPAPAPTPAPTPNTTFTGTWRGGVDSVSCSADGVFGASTCKDFPKLSDITIPAITNVRLTLTQTGDSVNGDMDFAGAWRLEVKGNIRNGRLAFSSNGTIPTQGLTFAVEGWDSGLSGTNGMSGDFTMRFWVTSGAPSGSARYKANLVSVTKQ